MAENPAGKKFKDKMPHFKYRALGTRGHYLHKTTAVASREVWLSILIPLSPTRYFNLLGFSIKQNTQCDLKNPTFRNPETKLFSLHHFFILPIYERKKNLNCLRCIWFFITAMKNTLHFLNINMLKSFFQNLLL